MRYKILKRLIFTGVEGTLIGNFKFIGFCAAGNFLSAQGDLCVDEYFVLQMYGAGNMSMIEN